MKRIAIFALSSTIAFAPLAAYASGFALNEESASTLGTAFAGAGVTDEAAVMFVNPAGISSLQGNHLQMGGTLYRIDGADFRNQGTTSVLNSSVTGNTSGIDQVVEAPYFYYTHQFSSQWTAGLGVYSPFGLVTAYDPNWVGRYEAVESHVNTLEINPVLAYKINNQLSVGAGPTIRYTEAKLTQAIDFGSLGAAKSIPGSIPQEQDGIAKIEGDGFGYGFKLGMTYEPTQDTKLGLGYRSRMTTGLGGQAHYALSSTGQILSNATGQFVNTGAATDLNTPQSVDLSVSHHLTQPLTLYGDLLWTGWSTFKQLLITYDNPNQAATTIAENWQDTVRVSIGASYDVTEKWTLRGGYSYDQSPVKNATYTTARIPDGDRHWLAVGAGYKITPDLKVNFAYDHLFLNSASIDNTVANATTLVGTWGAVTADLLTMDIAYNF